MPTLASIAENLFHNTLFSVLIFFVGGSVSAVSAIFGYPGIAFVMACVSITLGLVSMVMWLSGWGERIEKAPTVAPDHTVPAKRVAVVTQPKQGSPFLALTEDVPLEVLDLLLKQYRRGLGHLQGVGDFEQDPHAFVALYNGADPGKRIKAWEKATEEVLKRLAFKENHAAAFIADIENDPRALVVYSRAESKLRIYTWKSRLVVRLIRLAAILKVCGLVVATIPEPPRLPKGFSTGY